MSREIRIGKTRHSFPFCGKTIELATAYKYSKLLSCWYYVRIGKSKFVLFDIRDLLPTGPDFPYLDTETDMLKAAADVIIKSGAELLDLMPEKHTGPMVYIHEGPGKYLGSTVLVIAESAREARAEIKEALKSVGLTEPINITKVLPIEKSILYIDDGDY